MTQVFDPEDGHVERVTVLEAGPCFVTAIRRADRDGYDAVQVGFGEVREKRLQKASARPPEEGRRGTCRHLAEFAARPARSSRSAPSSRIGEVFEKGQKVKVSGKSKGKGFQGTIKRHNFHRGPVSHGSHNVRAPGLDRRLGRPGPGLQRHPRSRPDGRGARDPARPRDRRRARRREPAARPRLRPGAEGHGRRDQEDQ